MFSLPLNDLLPDQDPDAVHDDAFELDHVNVKLSPDMMLVLFVDRVTVAVELLPEFPPLDTLPLMIAPATSDPPPPPPPPQAVMIASKGTIIMCR